PHPSSFFYRSADHRHLHSFPTRRSSDLKPLCLMPLANRSPSPFASPLNPRATYVAPDARARVRGFTGFSITPSGVDFVTMPFSLDRKSTRLNSSHDQISYAVFCLKKKKK